MKDKKYTMIFTVVCVVTVLALSFNITRAQQSTLRVGVSEVDISPPPGLGQAGYAARKGTATGTLDPLFARVLVLEGKNSKAALIAQDLIGNFDEDKLNMIRKQVKDAHGIEDVVFTATHTHSGPSFGGRASVGITLRWENESVRKIIECIGEANDALQEAYLGTGFGEAYIGYNRRSNNTANAVRFNDDRPAMVNSYPVDQTVAVARFDDPQGNPIAVLMNYACHPVVFGHDNMRYSADYPGPATKWVTDHLPGNPVCFFIQGALGNVNPVTNPVGIEKGGVKIKNELGIQLGKEVVRISTMIKTEPVEDAEIKTVVKTIPFKSRWDPEVAKKTMLDLYGDEFFKYIEGMIKESYDVPLTILVIGNEFGICGFPGEFYVEFQKRLRNGFPDFPLFFAGFANGDFAYFPTIKAAAEGGYGANSVTTVMPVGAGEEMIDRAIAELYYMTGKLSHSQRLPGGE